LIALANGKGRSVISHDFTIVGFDAYQLRNIEVQSQRAQVLARYGQADIIVLGNAGAGVGESREVRERVGVGEIDLGKPFLHCSVARTAVDLDGALLQYHEQALATELFATGTSDCRQENRNPIAPEEDFEVLGADRALEDTVSHVVRQAHEVEGLLIRNDDIEIFGGFRQQGRAL
jgi:hypothetical protein